MSCYDAHGAGTGCDGACRQVYDEDEVGDLMEEPLSREDVKHLADIIAEGIGVLRKRDGQGPSDAQCRERANNLSTVILATFKLTRRV